MQLNFKEIVNIYCLELYLDCEMANLAVTVERRVKGNIDNTVNSTRKNKSLQRHHYFKSVRATELVSYVLLCKFFFITQ